MERKRIAEATKGVGRPKVGGEFKLVDHMGRPFTDGDMRGKYSLVRTPLLNSVFLIFCLGVEDGRLM